MVEQIKTAVLSILIVISLILTWQVWTYQPDLELLEEEGYEESDPLSESVSMREVIGPANITFHRGYEQWVTQGNESFIVGDITDEVLSSEWSDFQMLEDVEQGEIYERTEDMMEIILPTDVPLSFMDDVFADAEEDLLEEYSDTFTFERVLITDEDESRLGVQLVSFEEQQVLEGYTDLSIEQFQEEFMAHVDGSSVYQAFEQTVGSQSDTLRRPVYLPVEPLPYHRVQYNSPTIDEEQLIDYLFSDPESVIGPEADNGGELYRSSDRQMRMSRFENQIEFNHPQMQGNGTESQVVSDAYQYVDGHGGFTEPFQLYDWGTSSVQNDYAQFRMMIDGLPVLGTNVGRDYSFIQIEQQNEEVSNYERPAFSLQEEIADEEVELPGGEAVLNEIEERSDLEMRDIQDIRVGYELQRGQFATFSPYWYVRSDDNWYQLDFDDQEDNPSGLE